jgi:uncharacterized protein (DUF1786 family)
MKILAIDNGAGTEDILLHDDKQQKSKVNHTFVSATARSY